ncbi:VOC family protein [Actinoallomurus bryophytorum]|uniref:VOC family protein n=1 Tax=Actinoallomurus bryophytorum TaxID=1490222 RepID=UPI003CCC872D
MSELVARLQTLGATPADVGQGRVPWTVLADPEGNDALTPRCPGPLRRVFLFLLVDNFINQQATFTL